MRRKEAPAANGRKAAGAAVDFAVPVEIEQLRHE